MSDNCSFNSPFWHIQAPLTVIIALLLFIGCRTPFPKNIEAYYYPIEQLKDGKVYEYLSYINGTEGNSSYWLYQSFEEGNNTQLIGQSFNTEFEKNQYLRQDITSSGAVLNEYLLFVNQQDTITVDRLYDNIYPFAVKDTTSVYLYKLQYFDPRDSTNNTITRNRRYIEELDWEFNGQVYPAIQMALLEQIINEKDGAITIDLRGYEIYVKGIGLVYTERISNDGSTHLIDRLVSRKPRSAYADWPNP